jgi:hypothetical protein
MMTSALLAVSAVIVAPFAEKLVAPASGGLASGAVAGVAAARHPPAARCQEERRRLRQRRSGCGPAAFPAGQHRAERLRHARRPRHFSGTR